MTIRFPESIALQKETAFNSFLCLEAPSNIHVYFWLIRLKWIFSHLPLKKLFFILTVVIHKKQYIFIMLEKNLSSSFSKHVFTGNNLATPLRSSGANFLRRTPTISAAKSHTSHHLNTINGNKLHKTLFIFHKMKNTGTIRKINHIYF